MIAKDDIVIRKAILHILDTVHGDCILSNTLLDPGPDLYEFIRTHIYKIMVSDDTKDCEFNPETSPICPILEAWDESDEESFLSTSQTIAEKLYTAMGEGQDIPAADLLFVTFQAEGVIYLALLKMNYKESYTHAISRPEKTPADIAEASDMEDSMSPGTGIQADIVKSRALLPGPARGSRRPLSSILMTCILSFLKSVMRLTGKRYSTSLRTFWYVIPVFRRRGS